MFRPGKAHCKSPQSIIGARMSFPRSAFKVLALVENTNLLLHLENSSGENINILVITVKCTACKFLGKSTRHSSHSSVLRKK